MSQFKKVIDIILFMGHCGARFKRTELDEITNYIERMLLDHRIIEVFDDHENVAGYAFFSLCDDFEPFYKKKMWDYTPHFVTGRTAYVEKMVCFKWTKELRRRFEEEILNINPNAKYACWHRSGKKGDRKVFYTRREKCLNMK